MDKYIFLKATIEDIDEIFILIQKRVSWMDQNKIYHWGETNYLKYYPKNYYEQLVSKGSTLCF